MKRERRKASGLPKQKDEALSPIEHEYRQLEPLTWSPELYLAFKVLISARLCAAVWSNISDCDETYNYWEPTHYLMYGSGMQTWEYSPLYSIRSYAYLWLYALPGLVYDNLLQNQRMLVFYFMRCVIGFVEAGCEIYFYRAIRRKFGDHIARLYILLSTFSAGMFIASTAFLPSSFGMKMLMVSYAAWWNQNLFLAIFATAFSVLVGWPFVGALGIPIAIDIVFYKRELPLFVRHGMLSVMIILPFVMGIDTFYFGKSTIAAINIVVYNVFSMHGPDLYGTEPLSFYLKNGLINFNYAFPMALAALPLLLVTKLYKVPTERLQALPLLGMYIWFAIFFSQPHKEERFLFPVYPLINLNAVVTFDLIQRWAHKLYFKKKSASTIKHHLELDGKWWLIPLMISCFLGMSRSILLYKAYHAPISTGMELGRLANPESLSEPPVPTQPVHLCVGKEWHRFPNSFFLPDNWELHFIKSEFRGQLPKPFAKGKFATRRIPTDMNDANEEEVSRYFPLSKCNYLIDSETPVVSSREPNFTKHPDFRVVHSTMFLDTANSPIYSRLVYVPLVFEMKSSFVKYNILENVKLPVLYNNS